MAGHFTRLYKNEKAQTERLEKQIKQTAELAKPKLVKQIPESNTLDYLVDHATYLHAVTHVQWNAQDSVGVGQYVLITVSG
jgi:flagellar biosynthesis/type III secretory pathway protein FliH